jgi:hypothetical protein
VRYGYRKLNRLLNQDFWAELTFLYKSVFLQNYVMTFPETLYTKDRNQITHMTSFDMQLGQYEFLKSDFTAEQILDRLTIQALD